MSDAPILGIPPDVDGWCRAAEQHGLPGIRPKIAGLWHRLERAETERSILLNAFEDICDELGCAYDNEAALMAIHALKHPEQ